MEESSPKLEDIYPLSPMQEGLLFHSLQDPEAGLYVDQSVYTVTGAVDAERMERAWNDVSKRHSALRTCFVWDEFERPVQVVQSGIAAPFAYHDWSHLPATERERRTAAFLEQDRRAGFRLDEAPLWRITMVREAADTHRLIWTTHHAIVDGWSAPIVLDQVVAAYERPRSEVVDAPEGGPRYRDYIAWLQRQDHEAAQRFWVQRMEGFAGSQQIAPAASVSRDAPEGRPSNRSLERTLPAELVDELKAVARRARVTLNTVMQAAWALVLARYGDSDDVRFGTTVAGRPADIHGVEDIVGCLVNTLPARVGVPHAVPVTEWLRDVQRRMVELREYDYTPLTSIQRWVGASGANPLFDSIVVFENYPAGSERPTGLRLEPREVLQAPSVPMALAIVPKDGLRLIFYHDPAHFDGAAASRLAEHYLMVLRTFARDPAADVGSVSLLDERTRRILLDDWGRAEGARPERPIHVMVAETAARHPERAAVTCGAETWTYRDLDRAANRMARRLLDEGVVQGDVVAMALDRGFERIVTQLAILKTGAAYLPLDGDHPERRLRFMLEDARVASVVTTDAHAAAFHGRTLIVYDESSLAGHPSTPPDVAVGINDLAYIMYTSGSTGEPKGVSVPHRGITRLVQALGEQGMGRSDVVMHAAPAAFDASTFEVWTPLALGARLVVAPPGDLSLAALGGVLRDHAVTACWLTAPLFNLMVDHRIEDLRGLRHIITGGDVVSPVHVRKALETLDGCRVTNGYGPTENTTFTTLHVMEHADEVNGAIPIGRPIGNSRVYVLDAQRAMVAVGVVGELYVGGDGLALGYLHRPELTAERFVDDPYSGAPGDKMYRTGDLVRWRADGALDFVGRIDDQVKIRGHRVEPGEVERCLASHPGVKQAVVLVRQGGSGARLAAYVTGSGANGRVPTVSEQALRDHVAEHLPRYMVPAYFVRLDELPLTDNGKVDRAALPDPGIESAAPDGGAVPRTDAERTLAALWCDALGREAIGIHDDFFEAGGDSILAIQIVARAQQNGLHLTLRDLFTHPTISSVARVARKPVHREAAGPSGGLIPLAPIQQWFLSRPWAGAHHFNQSAVVRLPSDLDLQALQGALDALVARHDVLRVRFTQHDATWHQEVLGSDATPAVDVTHLDISGAPDRTAAFEEHADRLHGGFDLARPPLLRAAHIRHERDDAYLLLAAHHLIVDHVSWQVLLDELRRAYEALVEGRAVELPEPSTSFQTWVQSLTRAAGNGRFDEDVAWWADLVSSIRHAPSLPRDVDAPNTLESRRTMTVRLPRETTKLLLEDVPAAYNTRIDDALLCALGEAVAAWTGRTSVAIMQERHGRDHDVDDLDVSGTVGWFTTMRPVLLDLPKDADPSKALKSTKETLRASNGRDLAYMVGRYMMHDQRLDVDPEIVFNYLGRTDPAPPGDVDDFQAADLPVGRESAVTGVRPALLDLNGYVKQGELVFEITYSVNVHHDATIREFGQRFMNHIEVLVDHCLGRDHRGFTPSDFPLAPRLTQQALDRLARRSIVIEDIYGLSPMQHGMLFHAIEFPESGQYVEQFLWEVDASVDAQELHEAWNLTVNRFHALRSTFFWEGLEEPIQVVHGRASVPMTHLDWRDLDRHEGERRLESWLADDRLRGFDLREVPLMRLNLVRLAGGRRLLVWSFHHLLFDGWSLPIIREALDEAYGAQGRDAFQGGTPARPYREYISWLQRQDADQACDHWRNALEGLEEATPLPIGSERDASSNRSDAPGEVVVALPDSINRRIMATCRELGLTANTVIQAAWGLVHSRYSGRDDVVFGMTTSGRPTDLPGVTDMVGLFINTVPLRVRIPEQGSIRSFLWEVKAGLLSAIESSHVSLTKIQEWTGLTDVEALFESIVVYENYPDRSPDQAHGERRLSDAMVFQCGIEKTNYPLNLVVEDSGTAKRATFLYDRSRFERKDIEALARHFQGAIACLTGDTEGPISDVGLLAADEHDRMVHTWSGQVRPFPDESVHAAFERRSAEVPGNVAAVFGEERFTYGDLDEAANRLATVLTERGIAPGGRVALALRRSPDLLIAQLATLKVGACYVPLDVSQPPERLQWMVRDVQASVLLGRGGDLAKLASEDTDAIDLSSLSLDEWPPIGRSISVAPDALAYIMYTSGSTGQPKGVCVPHRAIARLAADKRYVDLGPGDHVAHASNVSFDASTFEIWSTLLNGATVVGIPQEALLAPEELRAVLERHDVNTMFVTTALLNLLARDAPTIFARFRNVLFGGEAVTPHWVERILDAGPPERLIHVYGPTESTTFATWYEVEAVPPGIKTIPIGRAIENTTVYVLDPWSNPTPVGIPGELFIGGDGLATGYWGRDELTATRFVPNPFSEDPHARMYRTGDLVRWNQDGNLEFVGRIDDQVKIRGHRVEPDEVSSVLKAHEAVDDAVVLAKPDAHGSKQLVAYVRAGQRGLLAEDLLGYLRVRIPAFMVPAHLVVLDDLPLTRNGKVDRDALPEPIHLRRSREEGEGPKTPIEKALAEVWALVLQVRDVRRQDDFFALGGHSLLAVQAASRIRDRFGIRLALGELFEHPTLAEMGARIEQGVTQMLDEISDDEAEALLARLMETES